MRNCTARSYTRGREHRLWIRTQRYVQLTLLGLALGVGWHIVGLGGDAEPNGTGLVGIESDELRLGCGSEQRAVLDPAQRAWCARQAEPTSLRHYRPPSIRYINLGLRLPYGSPASQFLPSVMLIWCCVQI